MNLIETSSISIEQITDILNFKNDNIDFGSHFNKILNEHRKLAFKRFEEFTEALKSKDIAIFNEVFDRWNQFTDEQKTELIMSPQISNICYWYKPDRLSDIGLFFIEALDAELSKRTTSFDKNRYKSLWTSNGDYLIKYDESKDEFIDYEAFRLENNVVLDFFSPYTQNITDADNIIAQSNQTYSYEEAFHIYEKFSIAMSPMLSQKSNVTEFMEEILNVIVFKKRVSDDNKRHFVCGSNYNYMGRLLIVNPELAKDEDLIDALVHESIHFLLDMIDEINGWIPEEINTNAQLIKMESKWSGRPLALRTFLHAIFVWYGLFNLWIYALRNELYDKEYALDKLAFIRKGFEKLDAEELSEFGVQFSAETINAITVAKNEVLKTKY